MISTRTLPLRNLAFHWRGNLPVLLGAMVGTAVLTGALLVGDSLRGSLRAKADRQRNGVQSAWVGTRFIRAEVAKDIPETEPAILLTGTVECDGRRATKVTVVGLPDGRKLFPGVTLANGACLSRRLADHLAAKAGATVRVNVEKPSAVPRGSLLGKRDADDTTLSLRLPVSAVLPADDPANDFSLSPAPGLPTVVYVPMEALQQRLGKAGLVNAMFSTEGYQGRIADPFRKALTLADWGVILRTERAQPAGRKVKGRELPYVSVESDRLVLDVATAQAIRASATGAGLSYETTTSYLANAIVANGKEIPYSIVSSLNLLSVVPPGPFLSVGRSEPSDDEIVLVDWPESPIKGLKPGDPVTLKFFEPETEGGAKEATVTLKFAGTIPLAGPAADPSLTPPFPGITDKLSVRDWKPPFPYDPSKIKPNDVHEQYWQDYRTTPKAYVSPSFGMRHFASRYGQYTSIRVIPKPGQSVEQTAESLREELLRTLDPDSAGFRFDPVAERLRVAGQGGQDFGGLFLGFSLFLIVSALLLIGLLFRLAVERRAKEVGLLLATGYSPKAVRRLIMYEGDVLSAVGSALGVALAMPYAGYLLKILVSLWPDPSVGTFLTLYVNPLSLVIGWGLGLFTALLAMFLALRSLVNVPPPQLLRGTTAVAEPTTVTSRWPVVVAVSLAIVAVGLLVGGGFAANPDAKAGCFFGGGALLLSAGMLLVRAWLRSPREKVVNSIPALAIRNATRNPGRSLLTVSLVASAAFLLAAVESFRRPPPPADWNGYTLIAESDVPLFQSFGTGPGFDDLMLGLEKAYTDKPTDEPIAARLAKAKSTLAGMSVMPIRVHGGDDASCLNLYRAGKPSVIGVPQALIEPLPGTDVVPTVVEQNTMMWVLKKSLGDVVELPNGAGEPTRFRLVKTLTDSPFQSELLIDDDAFRATFPKVEGYRLFLIVVPTGQDRAVAALLETGLAASGLTVTPVNEKVAGYQAVIGAYLTLFQLLGGFGLLLGVAGLAVVLVRSVWERSGEVALLRAVGYSRATVVKMVLIENAFLLLLGLVVGTVAAGASVAPHRIEGAAIPWVRLAVLLGGVLVAGVAAAILATLVAVRRPVVPGLRAE